MLIYFLSGISGSLLSVGLNDNVVSAGASGAIFGLFGALIYFGYTYRGYIGAMIGFLSGIMVMEVFYLLLSLKEEKKNNIDKIINTDIEEGKIYIRPLEGLFDIYRGKGENGDED